MQAKLDHHQQYGMVEMAKYKTKNYRYLIIFQIVANVTT